jgi:hypothetical protein
MLVQDGFLYLIVTVYCRNIKSKKTIGAEKSAVGGDYE